MRNSVFERARALFALACLSVCVCVARPCSIAAADPETVTVFEPAADGFRSIRIPAVALTQRGSVLAFAEARAAVADQAKNKIVLKRSQDGGKTWGKLAVIVEDGDRALNNPCVVVERASGAIILMLQSYPVGLAERSGQIRTGYDGDAIVRSLMIVSEDDGLTWSRPRDVTRETKRPERVTTVASGPGVGIQLRRGPHAGRLLFPFNEGPYGIWSVYAVYSDDRGRTWRIGANAPGGLIDDPRAPGKKTSLVNEVQFVELSDGSVRLNARRWGGRPVRKTCVSRDGGATWSNVEDAPELRDPSCMGSILRLPDSADGKGSRILYSGPQSDQRKNGTVFLSRDDGATWPVSRVLQPGGFAYSCLTSLPDGSVGCLYEADGMNRIVFARFTLDWLTAGKANAQE